MKRKTLAVLLSVLLVVSAVLVLTACNKEYTITFRNSNNAKMDELQTVKGKVEYTKKNLTADDRVFDGWYDSLTNNADGTQTYGKKVDLATTTFDKDTTLYAKWTLIGESVGYCLPGVINGETIWETDLAATNADRKLAHEEGTNVYTKNDLTLKQSDSFKLITALGKSDSWDLGKIQVGYSQLEVVIASGATLPDGVDGTDTDVLISAGDTNNININYDMIVDLRFEYQGTSDDSVLKITIKSASGSKLADEKDVGYMIAGDVSTWNGPIAADDELLSKYILTADSDKIVFSATGIEVAQGKAFKVKVNESSWNRGAYGFADMDLTKADGVELPDGKELADIFKTNADNNIIAAYSVVLNISFDTETKRIAVEITSLDATEQKPVSELGFFVVCTPNNFYNAATVPVTGDVNSKYVMAVDAQNDKLFTVAGIELKANQSFRTKVNTSGWNCAQYNYADAKFVLGDGVTLPNGKTVADLFKDEGGNDHNIIVNFNMTISLAINTSKETEALTITVTAVDATEQKPVEEVGFFVAGDVSTWTTVPADSPFVLVPDVAKKLFTVTGVQIPQDKGFQIKINEEAWTRGQYGLGTVRTVVFDASVTTLPEGITADTANLVFEGDTTNVKANIKAKYAMTVTVVLDLEAGKLDITITVINPVRDESAPEAGFSIAGSLNGWGSETPKIQMTANAEKTVFTKEGLELALNDEFQIKNGETGNWTPQYGSDKVKNVVLDDGVELPEGKTVADLFDLTGSNIKALNAMTVTVVLDYTTKEITITVTAVVAETVTPTPEA